MGTTSRQHIKSVRRGAVLVSSAAKDKRLRESRFGRLIGDAQRIADRSWPTPTMRHDHDAAHAQERSAPVLLVIDPAPDSTQSGAQQECADNPDRTPANLFAQERESERADPF